MHLELILEIIYVELIVLSSEESECVLHESIFFFLSSY